MELYISRIAVRKYLLDFKTYQKDSVDKITSFSRYLSKPLVYQGRNRAKVKLIRDIEAAIDQLIEKNKEKSKQGLRKQLLKKIDIFEALHGMGYEIGYTILKNGRWSIRYLNPCFSVGCFINYVV